MVRAIILLVCALLAVPESTPAQDVRAARHPEAGRPVVRNVLPEEYGGGGQNWAIVQDRRGVLYVGGAFAGGAPQFDDITLMVLRRL